MPEPMPALEIDDATELTRATWLFLEREMAQLNKPLLGPVQTMAEFLAEANDEKNATSLDDRLAIIKQAELLLNDLYPHLPFKLEKFRLDHPREFLQEAKASIHSDEATFQGRMLAAFSRVKDAHTNYTCPLPWRGSIAFLPFQMKTMIDNQHPFANRYFVTKLMMRGPDQGFGHDSFGPGAEVVGWGATTIEDYIRAVAEWLPGGNEAALHARGTLAATLRPLGSVHPPFIGEALGGADILYIPKNRREVRAIRVPWGVARFTDTPAIPGSTFSISSIHEDYNTGLRMQCREAMRMEQRNATSQDFRAVSHIPEVFEFQFTGGPMTDHPIDIEALSRKDVQPARRYGYLRIKAFRDDGKPVGMADRLVEEARRILTLLDQEAPDGLIIDIRGNAGGEIKAAERILQMLTPSQIEPELFHYAATEAVLNAIRRVRAGQGSSAALAEFEDSQADADRVPRSKSRKKADRLTTGIPITNPASANDIGQVYDGPITLLTDAFTYSAADIFAAGFQDHFAGFVLGVDQFTGGGGANVRNHSELVPLAADFGLELATLPRDVGMRVAFRRCSRKGFFEGEFVEDAGVQVTEVYTLKTIDDLLAGFPGMIKEAVRLFSLRNKSDLQVEAVEPSAGGFRIQLKWTNLFKIRFVFDGDPADERDVAPSGAQEFEVSPPARNPNPFSLRVEGLLPVDKRPGLLVRNAAQRVELRPPEVSNEEQNITVDTDSSS